jgi:hypothetical protein
VLVVSRLVPYLPSTMVFIDQLWEDPALTQFAPPPTFQGWAVTTEGHLAPFHSPQQAPCCHSTASLPPGPATPLPPAPSLAPPRSLKIPEATSVSPFFFFFFYKSPN